MKKLIPFIMTAAIGTATASTNYIRTCDGFTPEQERLLWLAFNKGYEADRGYTLAAIVWRESIVGDYIIKVNPSDGRMGSYGVGHVLLTTAMYMLEIDSTWEARATLIPKLINDDSFALDLSLDYLLRFDHLPLRQQVAKYNGTGAAAEEYADDVLNRIKFLQNCNYFEE